jgi:hypothetical protein
MDYHWAAMQQPRNRPLSESTSTTTLPTTYRERVTTSLPLSEYSLTNFFAYAVYPALYIAGPIMSFNDFTYQLRHPHPPTQRALWSYAMRFATCFLTMELVLHYMYVVAIKDSGAWQGDTPAQLCMIGFWNLIVVWLKVGLFNHSPQRHRLSVFPAPRTVAVLPPVGSRRRYGPAREYGQVHGQQLLDIGLLA